MGCRSLLVWFMSIALSESAWAQTHILYDGELDGGNETPSSQGFIYGYSPLFGNGAQQVASGGLNTLKTLPTRSDQAGYFSYFPLLGSHPNMPATLDHDAGFNVDFTLRVLSEEHNTRDDNNDGFNDRAGFSVMVISSDLRGIELGFWNNEVWAYEDDAFSAGDLFTHGEGTTGFDPTAGVVDYRLVVIDNHYQLLADDMPILAGSLRNYSHASVSIFNPYTHANLLFFGDDTTSAGSVTQIGRIAVTVPEPVTIGLLVAAAGSMRSRRHRLIRRD